MDVEISKTITRLQVREGKNFIDIDLSHDLDIYVLTSSFNYEDSIQYLIELPEDDLQLYIKFINECRIQLTKIKNNEV